MNIDSLLKEKGMTKTMLAEKMGIRSQNVNVALKNPTEETMRKIATALEVEVWELFTSEDGSMKEQERKNTIPCPYCGKPIDVSLLRKEE
jgi:lambda repressor-like predicted transcriptional regulator